MKITLKSRESERASLGGKDLFYSGVRVEFVPRIGEWVIFGGLRLIVKDIEHNIPSGDTLPTITVIIGR